MTRAFPISQPNRSVMGRGEGMSAEYTHGVPMAAVRASTQGLPFGVATPAADLELHPGALVHVL